MFRFSKRKVDESVPPGDQREVTNKPKPLSGYGIKEKQQVTPSSSASNSFLSNIFRSQPTMSDVKPTFSSILSENSYKGFIKGCEAMKILVEETLSVGITVDWCHKVEKVCDKLTPALKENHDDLHTIDGLSNFVLGVFEEARKVYEHASSLCEFVNNHSEIELVGSQFKTFGEMRDSVASEFYTLKQHYEKLKADINARLPKCQSFPAFKRKLELIDQEIKGIGLAKFAGSRTSPSVEEMIKQNNQLWSEGVLVSFNALFGMVQSFDGAYAQLKEPEQENIKTLIIQIERMLIMPTKKYLQVVDAKVALLEHQQAPSTSSTSTSDETASLAERIEEREKNLKRYVDDALSKNYPKGIGNPMEYDILLILMEKAMRAYPYPAASIVDVCSLEELKKNPPAILKKYRNKTADEYIHQFYPENTLKLIHKMANMIVMYFANDFERLGYENKNPDPSLCNYTQSVMDLLDNMNIKLADRIQREAIRCDLADWDDKEALERYKKLIRPRLNLNTIMSVIKAHYFYKLPENIVERLTDEIKEIYAAIKSSPNLTNLSIFSSSPRECSNSSQISKEIVSSSQQKKIN